MSQVNTTALAARDVHAGYGSTLILEGVSFEVSAGSTVAVLGRNGVGKTTLLRTLMGYTTLRRGALRVGSRSVEGLPTEARVYAGLGYVPQGRDIFVSLTVHENLSIACKSGPPTPNSLTPSAVYEMFPPLKARRHTLGGRLSGGEQQMLAIGRALVGGPAVLLLDEPFEGLAPVVVDQLLDRLSALRGQMTIVLVEPNIERAVSFASRALVLERGRVVYDGATQDLDAATSTRLLGLS
jgi:branched-chain amino acid transport system ATP-binding protein